ncbi:MAG: hypothetical protein CYPHOPRED_001710 [Cyphobasidiales sp. Tagirdzhanova-0007]|nr:MAG: hypothetical protein CYPHOPRED_001710 [Cyphobasidiales sp. Tagirdzhanova-0007]
MLYSSLSPFAAFLTVATLHIPLATAAPSHRSRHVRVSRDSHVKRASAWAYKTYAASPAPSPADCVNIFACEPVDSGAAPSTPLPVQPSPSPRPNQLNYTNLTTSDLPAGIVRATTTLGAASSCPAGSTYATFSDNFAIFDSSKWVREIGTDEAISYGDEGLLMYLSKDADNIVFQSIKQWVPPVTMSVSMKTTNAPGIVQCAIFKNEDASDEIDLELIQGRVDTPIWKDAVKPQLGVDVVGGLGSGVSNISAWSYHDSNALPYDAIHDWTVQWDTSSIKWTADGNAVVEYTKIGDTKMWPSEALHVRFGPWAAPGTWAGIVDWTANPSPVQQITQLEVTGCMVD